MAHQLRTGRSSRCLKAFVRKSATQAHPSHVQTRVIRDGAITNDNVLTEADVLGSSFHLDKLLHRCIYRLSTCEDKYYPLRSETMRDVRETLLCGCGEFDEGGEDGAALESWRPPRLFVLANARVLKISYTSFMAFNLILRACV